MQRASLVPVSSCNAAIILHADISACEKGEQWQQARCLLAVMQETDLVPNVNTYSAAIGAARKVYNGRRHLAFWG